eukprot:10800190-Heterocapsa_arctica.AAC.1
MPHDVFGNWPSGAARPDVGSPCSRQSGRRPPRTVGDSTFAATSQVAAPTALPEPIAWLPSPPE